MFFTEGRMSRYEVSYELYFTGRQVVEVEAPNKVEALSRAQEIVVRRYPRDFKRDSFRVEKKLQPPTVKFMKAHRKRRTIWERLRDDLV